MATKAKGEVTIFDQTDATAIRSWYHAQTSAVTPSAPTTTTASDTPSGWTLAEPTISGASDLSKYVYRCEQLVWGDGTCDWGTVTLSTSYEAAKVAYNEAQSAKATATRYITDLGNGIMVHPNGDATTGWSIRDALEMLKSGVSVFRVWLEDNAPKVRIGTSDSFYAIIDSAGMAFKRATSTILSFERYNDNDNEGIINFAGDAASALARIWGGGSTASDDYVHLDMSAGGPSVLDSKASQVYAAIGATTKTLANRLTVWPTYTQLTKELHVGEGIIANGIVQGSSLSGSLAASYLTGTIDSARLPIVPRTKGGTGTTKMTTTAVTRTGVSTAGNFYAYHNGVSVTIGADSVRLKTALANGANVALGTAPDGCKPPNDMYAYLATANTTFAGKCMVRLAESGNITLYNASGSSLATSVNINFTITFTI